MYVCMYTALITHQHVMQIIKRDGKASFARIVCAERRSADYTKRRIGFLLEHQWLKWAGSIGISDSFLLNIFYVRSISRGPFFTYVRTIYMYYGPPQNLEIQFFKFFTLTTVEHRHRPTVKNLGDRGSLLQKVMTFWASSCICMTLILHLHYFSVAGHSIFVIIFIPLGDIEIVLLSLQMVFYFAMHIHVVCLILCQ